MPRARRSRRLAAESTLVRSGLRGTASDASPARTGWNAPGIWTANGPQSGEKSLSKANLNPSLRYDSCLRRQANIRAPDRMGVKG
jgi:hypothetical protein